MAEPKDAPPKTPKPGWLAEQRSTIMGRANLWYCLGLFVPLVLACAWQFGPFAARGWATTRWTNTLMFVPFFLTNTVFVVWSRRFKRRVTALGFRMCKHCGYDLREIPEPGPCPECGRAFDVAKLASYWKHGG